MSPHRTTPARAVAEAPVAEAAPFPWAILIIVAAALALGAITTLLLTRRKKA